MKKPRKTKKPPPPPKLISLLERQQFKKWDLKSIATPKKVLLWMGMQLAKFFRRCNKPIKENRIIFGSQMLVCVYPEWWWKQHGDTFVTKQIEYLQRNPKVMEKWVEPAKPEDVGKENEPA